MPDDVIEIKPKLGPFTLNLNALWRWLGRRPKGDRVTLAAQRFLHLFEAHGVAATQIQLFLPELTLDKVQKPETLLSSLTPGVLEQAAQLFRVRRTWLEGVDNEIYDCAFCYQAPDEFFEELAGLRHERGYAPIRGLRCTKTLDYRDSNPQPITLVFIERIRELGDVEVFRYRIFGDGWDWNYPKARIQLKAMIRVAEKLHYGPVPLDPTTPAIVEKVREGRLIPRAYLRRPFSSEPSLEDYVCTPEEHRQAKECDELPYVQKYIEDENLLEIARQKLSGRRVAR